MSGYTKISFGVFKTKDGMIIKEVRSVKNEGDYTLTYLSKEDIKNIKVMHHPVEEGKCSIQLTPLSIIVIDLEALPYLATHILRQRTALRRRADILENGL